MREPCQSNLDRLTLSGLEFIIKAILQDFSDPAIPVGGENRRTRESGTGNTLKTGNEIQQIGRIMDIENRHIGVHPRPKKELAQFQGRRLLFR